MFKSMPSNVMQVDYSVHIEQQSSNESKKVTSVRTRKNKKERNNMVKED